MVSLSPNIGKIAGIQIQLHWTFVLLLVLAFLLLFTSTTGIFLFLLIVLLFVCVLIHEMAHSLTSQWNGIKVKKIILLPIGGASIIDFDKIDPRTEFRIAMAGPLTSIVLGLIFGIFVVYTPAGFLKEGLQFLFEINILLGLFNLLPGFPLDGGRILRSYLQKKRSFLDATKFAVKVSNVVIVAFIIGTIIYAIIIPNATFFYREFVVIWDIVIALFLYDGAKLELQSSYIKSYTSKMKIEDLISKNYILITSTTTVQSMYKTMIKKGTHIILLKKGKKILTLTNPSLGKIAGDSKILENDAIMASTKEIPAINYTENLSRAIEVMRNEDTNIVAVIKNGNILGIIYGPQVESIIGMYLSHVKDGKAGVNTSNK
jgi:Zn-dependent protease/CBS domain-containing protein